MQLNQAYYSTSHSSHATWCHCGVPIRLADSCNITTTCICCSVTRRITMRHILGHFDLILLWQTWFAASSLKRFVASTDGCWCRMRRGGLVHWCKRKRGRCWFCGHCKALRDSPGEANRNGRTINAMHITGASKTLYPPGWSNPQKPNCPSQWGIIQMQPDLGILNMLITRLGHLGNHKLTTTRLGHPISADQWLPDCTILILTWITTQLGHAISVNHPIGASYKCWSFIRLHNPKTDNHPTGAS